MLAWRVGYDAAGLLDDEAPPAELKVLVQSADLVVSSDFPRAVQTAERLLDGRPFPTSQLLREAPTDVPPWNGVRLPRRLWEWAMLARWGYRILRGTDIPPQDLARGLAAARWLDDLSTQHTHIAVATHGVFRRILARQLLTVGWQPRGKWRSYDHWSVWSLSKPGVAD